MDKTARHQRQAGNVLKRPSIPFHRNGILNKTEPAAPIDKDLYELPPEEHASVNTVPDSLDGVLDNLEADHDYLLAGDVFTPDLIETWIELKRDDIDAVRLRPHPHEFELYYDV